MKLRRYKVWVSGSKASTETKVLARSVDCARIKFASSIGKKSYEVDAVWDREYKVPTLGYCASK